MMARTRAGRELERLVATIEEAVAGLTNDVTVSSPGHIDGLLSGASREIDVLIRGRIATTDVVVAIECRDRDRREDVQWIDALVGKRSDTGVSKMIGVSSSGFSKAAKRSATGIELREMRSVSAEDVFGWLDVGKFTYESRKVLISWLGIAIDAKLPGQNFELENGLPILFRSEDGSRISPLEVWEASADLRQICADLIPVGSGAVDDEVVLSFDDPWPFGVKTNLGMRPVTEFHVRGRFTVERTNHPIETLNSYRASNGETISESAEVKVEHEGREIVFGIVVDQTSAGRRYAVTAQSADERSAVPLGMNIDLTLRSPRERQNESDS